MNRLATLSEEPINEEEDDENETSSSKKRVSWMKRLKTHLSFTIFNKKSDLKLLLSVLACPLFPVSALPLSPNSEISSSAQYIIQQFAAATGCKKLEGRVKNTFVTGRVTMASVDELRRGSGGLAAGGGASHKGCFVMWQMLPNKWLIELVLAGHKVAAGSDGKMAWRHTPWLGEHAARGGVRPLRRALQGLDPLTISSVFSTAQYIGEKQISGTECFVLKLSAEQSDLTHRSDNMAEMIKHVVFGYFSQRSGLLVYLEDSSLTRIQSPGCLPTYWETWMCSSIEDYRPIEELGVVVAHSGRMDVFISRFGDSLKGGVSITRMEETWKIDDVAFDVPGLSADCFIPPKEVKKGFYEDRDFFRFDWRSELNQ